MSLSSMEAHIENVSRSEIVFVFRNTFLNMHSEQKPSQSALSLQTDENKGMASSLFISGINISVASSGRAVLRSVSFSGLMTNSEETSRPFLSSRKQNRPREMWRYNHRFFVDRIWSAADLSLRLRTPSSFIYSGLC